MDFNYKDIHSCDAAVIICVDFRFTELYLQGIRDTFDVDTFDIWSMPGVAKNFVTEENRIYVDKIIESIKTVSIGLHNIKRIIVVDHADCGAYGGRKAFETINTETNQHNNDLKVAQEKLKKEFPDIDVNIGLLTLSEDMEECDVIELE